MKYKVGDIIGHNTMDGTFLCEVTEVYNINDKDLCETCLTVKRLYDDRLEKPWVNVMRSIMLPQQQYEILTLEEYINMVQGDIKRRQKILDEIACKPQLTSVEACIGHPVYPDRPYPNNIHAIKEALGLSNMRLGKLCGLSYSVIANFDRGDKPIKDEQKELIEAATGFRVERYYLE